MSTLSKNVFKQFKGKSHSAKEVLEFVPKSRDFDAGLDTRLHWCRRIQTNETMRKKIKINTYTEGPIFIIIYV